MKFHGLDPRTRWLRWGLLALALGIVIGSTAPSAIRSLAQAAVVQHDMLPWYASRLLAFLSYFAVAGSVVYGLLLSTKLLDEIAHRPISFTLHQDLASIGLGLAGVHGMLLALDKTYPQTLAQIVVPFGSPYRPLWVGVGQVALWLMVVVVGSFYVRRRIGQRAWRLLHYTTFLAFVGATAHGLLSGTDSGQAWAWWSYVIPTVAVVFLLVYRIAISLAARFVGVPEPRSGPAGARMTMAPPRRPDASATPRALPAGRPLPAARPFGTPQPLPAARPLPTARPLPAAVRPAPLPAGRPLPTAGRLPAAVRPAPLPARRPLPTAGPLPRPRPLPMAAAIPDPPERPPVRLEPPTRPQPRPRLDVRRPPTPPLRAPLTEA